MIRQVLNERLNDVVARPFFFFEGLTVYISVTLDLRGINDDTLFWTYFHLDDTAICAPNPTPVMIWLIFTHPHRANTPWHNDSQVVASAYRYF